MTGIRSEERRTASPADKVSVDRRAAQKRVREARDRLTSTTGTRPAFDYELLRQFAQNRQSASLAILLLVATVGFLSGLWIGPILASVWTLCVLGVHTIIIAQCRSFLAEAPASVKITRWRVRFVMLDMLFGIA